MCSKNPTGITSIRYGSPDTDTISQSNVSQHMCSMTYAHHDMHKRDSKLSTVDDKPYPAYLFCSQNEEQKQ